MKQPVRELRGRRMMEDEGKRGGEGYRKKEAEEHMRKERENSIGIIKRMIEMECTISQNR